MDTVAMLQELLAQNQFELLFPEPVEEKTEKTEKTGHSFRLVYLMNVAVEIMMSSVTCIRASLTLCAFKEASASFP